MCIRDSYTTDQEGVLQTFLEADGFISHAPSTSYSWEQSQRTKIDSGKMRFIPVWSLKWWKNPKEEARKLASEIIKLDKAISKKKIAIKKAAEENIKNINV